MQSLPSSFKDRVLGVHGHRGRAWLDALPALQDEFVKTWELRELKPVSDLSYNYLAFARQKTGTSVVLKLGVPHHELTSEIEALKVYHGRSTVRLLAADPGRGALLLERLLPGEDLRLIRDDRQATEIAARLMKKLRLPDPGQAAFPTAADWCRGFQRYLDTYPAAIVLYEKSETARKYFHWMSNYIKTLICFRAFLL